jgi:hypothetical protein
MREELVTPTTARRLAQEGLAWDPQPGDWVTALGGAHMDEGLVGLWLVASVGPDGQLTLADATGRWPQSRGIVRDCLWLPSAGKLKVWLRGRGFRVATGEITARLLGGEGAMSRHVCRLSREDGTPPVDGEGMNEAEAVAVAALQALGAGTADSAHAW